MEIDRMMNLYLIVVSIRAITLFKMFELILGIRLNIAQDIIPRVKMRIHNSRLEPEFRAK